MKNLIQKYRQNFPKQANEAHTIFKAIKKEFLERLDLELKNSQKMDLIEKEHDRIKIIYKDKTETEILKLLNSDPKQYLANLFKLVDPAIPHLTQKQGKEFIETFKKINSIKKDFTATSNNKTPDDFVKLMTPLINSPTSDRLISSLSGVTSFEEMDQRIVFDFFISDERKQYFDFLDKLYHQLENPSTIHPNFPPPPISSEYDQEEVEAFLHQEMNFLQGENRDKEPIMSKEDFESLYSKTLYLILKQKIPVVDRQFRLKGITKLSHYQLYHRIYKKMKRNTSFRELCIQFLHTFFPIFDNVEINSSLKKFGSSAKKYPF